MKILCGHRMKNDEDRPSGRESKQRGNNIWQMKKS